MWQQPNDFSQLNESTPHGFVYICQPRHTGRGGLAIIYREKWKVSPVSVPVHISFESVVLQVNGPTPTIATVYHPPKPNKDFIHEFSTFLTHICSLSSNIILLGDINIHMDNINHPLTKDFTSCLDSFGLQQHIHFPTHSKGHVLDLVCCSGVTPFNCSATDLPISDHMLITFNMNLILSKTKPLQVISYRNIKNNLSALTSGFCSLLNINSSASTDELVSHYNAGLHTLLDSLAPLKTRTVSFTHSAPWFSSHLRQLKAKGRQLERLYTVKKKKQVGSTYNLLPGCLKILSLAS